jgi:predicted RNA binding protein YcfA (HicA-like mRNA interferase family)
MGRIPVLKPVEVVAILVNLGFSEVRRVDRTSGFVTVLDDIPPCLFHQGRYISPILLMQIGKDIALTVDDLLKYR